MTNDPLPVVRVYPCGGFFGIAGIAKLWYPSGAVNSDASRVFFSMAVTSMIVFPPFETFSGKLMEPN